MPSNQSLRLTKKQKKATAFRERSGKGKGKIKVNLDVASRRSHTTAGENGLDDDEDVNALPAMEDPALAEVISNTERDAESNQSRAGILKAATLGTQETATKKKKRRREDAEAQPVQAAKRARFASSVSKIPSVAHDEDDLSVNAGHKTELKKDRESKQQRCILFIGNLKYTTTREAIQNHFSVCDPPPIVRLLTPKVTRAGATVAKSKGCAFLEFSAQPALQVALRLHQSELDGRRINVELTAGGGGKGDTRLAKLKTRNKQLAAQRTRRSLKAVTPQGNKSVLQETLQPQRFSTTSGESDVPHTKRTWTVGDGNHRSEHRGGKKVGKKRGTRTKGWGTGVNALPIG